MIVFNHIPRTAGTFLAHKLHGTSLCGGPVLKVPQARRATPSISCDVDYRPVMMTYHIPGRTFERVYKRNVEDFVFCFLRNRADMEYSNYAYMQSRVARGDDLGPYADQANLYKGSPDRHIDNILETNYRDMQYPSSLEFYSFVGISEHMSLSLSVLGDALGLGLQDDVRINTVASDKGYRRRELEELFSNQNELYRLALGRLTNGYYRWK